MKTLQAISECVNQVSLLQRCGHKPTLYALYFQDTVFALQAISECVNYNHATSNLAIYSHETPQNKLSEA